MPKYQTTQINTLLNPKTQKYTLIPIMMLKTHHDYFHLIAKDSIDNSRHLFDYDIMRGLIRYNREIGENERIF